MHSDVIPLTASSLCYTVILIIAAATDLFWQMLPYAILPASLHILLADFVTHLVLTFYFYATITYCATQQKYVIVLYTHTTLLF